MTNREKLDTFLKRERDEQLPRISIYMPTHRKPPDNQQDPIVYKNLVTEAEKELEAKYPRRDWETAIGNLRNPEQGDSTFWSFSQEGLCVLACGEDIQTFRLQYAPGAKVLVGGAFHLLRILAYLERYDAAILADIGRDRVSTHLVNRYSYEVYEVPDLKYTMAALFDDFDANSNLRTGSYGGLQGSFHGHRGGSEDADKDRDKYFHYLDAQFAEVNRKEGLPLLLSGTAETLVDFRKIAKGSFYLDTTIDQPLDSLEHAQVQALVREALDPVYREGLERTLTRLRRAQQGNLVVHKSREIEEAAKEGRVEELLVDTQRLDSRDTKLNKAVLYAVGSGARISALRETPQGMEAPYSAILRW